MSYSFTPQTPYNQPAMMYGAPQAQQFINTGPAMYQQKPVVKESHRCAVLLACFVCCCCNCPFGLLAFLLAIEALKSPAGDENRCYVRVSFGLSIVVSIVGIGLALAPDAGVGLDRRSTELITPLRQTRTASNETMPSGADDALLTCPSHVVGDAALRPPVSAVPTPSMIALSPADENRSGSSDASPLQPLASIAAETSTALVVFYRSSTPMCELSPTIPAATWSSSEETALLSLLSKMTTTTTSSTTALSVVVARFVTVLPARPPAPMSTPSAQRSVSSSASSATDACSNPSLCTLSISSTPLSSTATNVLCSAKSIKPLFAAMTLVPSSSPTEMFEDVSSAQTELSERTALRSAADVGPETFDRSSATRKPSSSCGTKPDSLPGPILPIPPPHPKPKPPPTPAPPFDQTLPTVLGPRTSVKEVGTSAASNRPSSGAKPGSPPTPEPPPLPPKTSKPPPTPPKQPPKSSSIFELSFEELSTCETLLSDIVSPLRVSEPPAPQPSSKPPPLSLIPPPRPKPPSSPLQKPFVKKVVRNQLSSSNDIDTQIPLPPFPTPFANEYQTLDIEVTDFDTSTVYDINVSATSDSLIREPRPLLPEGPPPLPPRSPIKPPRPPTPPPLSPRPREPKKNPTLFVEISTSDAPLRDPPPLPPKGPRPPSPRSPQKPRAPTPPPRPPTPPPPLPPRQPKKNPALFVKMLAIMDH